MKQHIFTNEERQELESNPNILKVINSNVEYTEEFKERVLKEQEESGKSAKQLFWSAGIPDWLNEKTYAKDCIKRWKTQKRKPSKKKRGRAKIEASKPLQEMSIEELRKRVAYLELENEFLKKLEPLEQYKEMKF